MTAQSFNFGAKAGPQITYVTHVSDSKAALRYHVGAFAQMPLAARLKGQAELLLSAQGSNDTESDYFRQRNLYLQLPLTAKYEVMEKLSVHAGFQLGFLMSAKLKVSGGNYEGTYDRKEYYKKAELGLVAGSEYQLTEHFGVGMRMHWGLTEVFDGYESRHRAFQVFAAYTL